LLEMADNARKSLPAKKDAASIGAMRFSLFLKIINHLENFPPLFTFTFLLLPFSLSSHL
jgi:hypothetical protein